jgi:5-methyltetrahydrofolate--homocysteine methyltransferase
MEPEARLAVARKIVQRASQHGIPPEDVLIDPLVLTVAAEPEAARVTLRTMQLVRDTLGVNLVCGASNVSFGLPDRSPLNAAFLAMAMPAGLTCAITDNTNPAIRQAILAADVLLGHDPYATAWIGDYRARKRAAERAPGGV